MRPNPHAHAGPPDVAQLLTAALFVATGIAHFLKPAVFRRIVPPGLPFPEALVAVSGVAEIAGAVGLLTPRWRKPAGWGLVALLVAVFPANVYMAVRADAFGDLAPPWVLWARLPLQGVLIAWVGWIAGMTRRAGGSRTFR